MSLAAYMCRRNSLVVFTNLGRRLDTGDNSRPPDKAWWERVAASLPLSLTTPHAVDQMRAAAHVFKENTMKLEVGASAMCAPSQWCGYVCVPEKPAHT